MRYPRLNYPQYTMEVQTIVTCRLGTEKKRPHPVGPMTNQMTLDELETTAYLMSAAVRACMGLAGARFAPDTSGRGRCQW